MSSGTPTGIPAPSEEPRRFGNYLLLKELGRGAQGVVHLAEDATLHRKVALKMLTGAGLQSQESRDRFRREAQLTSKFEHPGICGVHDVGEVDGVPYIAMQYVRGTTLASIVEKSRGTSPTGSAQEHGSDTITIAGGGSKGGLEDVLRLIERAARALHVAHEGGLVHRDVKPANIMVTNEGHPVLLDFGLARDIEAEGQTLTQSGQIMGTPAYLAPEQIVAARGKVDRRTDVYALGVTLFECLTLKRPFESTTWDQLFHEILDGSPRNPRKLNPRIPEDLRTIIEVAMDRDQARRYPSAEAFAEDLRRVRSFEPIQAKAAGPITRALKWSRRNPGRATAAAAVIVFVLVAIGAFVTRTVQRSRDLRANLVAAQDALLAADYVGAAIAVAKARELDPESLEVRELAARVEHASENAQREADKKKALADAVAARAEAATLAVSYAQTRKEIDALKDWMQRNKSNVLARYAPEDAHGDYWARGAELEALQSRSERALFSRTEALERARRLEETWGKVSSATLGALAGFYMERWREALAEKDAARAETMRAAVEANDPNGEHRAELLGRGKLTLALLPAHAQAFLFRYEPYGAVRAGDVIPRLVPVPTAGTGRIHEGEWAGGFHPGDPCLVVRSVEPGSIAEKSGLAAGDLVLRYGAEPATGWVAVRTVEPGSCLERAGVSAGARITDVDGHSIGNAFEWLLRVSRPEGEPPKVSVDGIAAPLDCEAASIAVADVLDLIQDGSSARVTLTCLARGELRTIDLAPGARAGMHCERTAYPLVLAKENRIDAGVSREMDPGSYLVWAQSAGFENQRFHVVVGRGQDVSASLELLPAGRLPEGFVYVPPGSFIEGGDDAAFRPRAARDTDVPGFMIARRELTNREWYEFVNDPATLEKIAARKPGTHMYLPEDDRVMAKPDASGEGWTWDVYTADTAESPVLGVTWTDVHDYVEWRNARAAQRNEPWRYDLPTEAQWEKAARGVDGRVFPWGDRFDPLLAIGGVRGDVYLLDAPGGSELRDESPFGLFDAAGSREEWLRDPVPDSEKPLYYKRGGYWATATESWFHCSSRGSASSGNFAASQGVRLVARRADQ